MTRAFVTGGTGFVGGHLVRALLTRGVDVRCLVRSSSPSTNLQGLRIETVRGDLTDIDSLRGGVAGCDAVFHCAADYRLFVRDPAPMFAANVDGTRNVLQACADAGVSKIVYTSTVGALGLNADGSPADEDTPVTVDEMTGPYKKSKFLAEREAEKWAREGLPVVIVNPSAPVGDLDVKPTPTGQMVIDFLLGRMKAFVDTGLNLVDVKDVAEGHVLAAERGRLGEKYILGHANLTLEQILQRLARITGQPAPRVRLPHWIPLGVAAVDTGFARLTRREPRFALDAVKLSKYKMFFSPAKAVRELGLPQTDVDEPLRRAVEWFRAHGYVPAHTA